MEKLLVATYDQDLLQFEMFCYCINKNWKGNRFLTIVLNSSADWDITRWRVNDIVDRYLCGWHAEIVDGRHLDHDGYREQAVNKIIFSIDDRFNDTIVFDSKDFLLRGSDLFDFKKDGKYRVTFTLDRPHLDLYPEAKDLLDKDISHIPAVLNLTPWIWNIDQLKKYWNYMSGRFGDFSDWDSMFKGGTESDTYYVYTFCDELTSIKFLDPRDNPLMIGGGWTYQTYEGIVQEAQDFDRWSERKIWKHSRKLEDPRCLNVTRSVLLKYGIEREIIDRVFGRQGTPGESS